MKTGALCSYMSAVCLENGDVQSLNDGRSVRARVRNVKRLSDAVCLRKDSGVHRVLVGKPEGKRPLGRPRRRCEDNIKMDLQEFEGGRGDWMELAQDRDRWRALVGTIRDLRVP